MKLDLSKIDVVDFLNELGMMKIRRDGNEVTFSCPFGLHMRGGAISMQIGTTLCHCFGCGFKGNALTFLQEYEELSTKEAILWLGERWDVSRKIETDNFKSVIKKRLERSEKKRNTIIEPKNYDIPVISILELDERAVDWEAVDNSYSEEDNTFQFEYLLDRGFTVETLIDWSIGWDELSQTFSIPYHDEFGNLIGFKGRALPGVIPKYKVLGNKIGKENRYNFNSFDVSSVLFGIDRFKDSKSNSMIICEGELNCISMHQDGFTNTVGISGQFLSDRQIDLVKKHAQKVTLIFDEWDRMVEIAEQLRAFIPVSIVLEHDKDPAEMTQEEKSLLLLNAVSGILVK